MERQLKDLTLEQWLPYVFDHPVPEGDEKEWYWNIDRDWWDD